MTSCSWAVRFPANNRVVLVIEAASEDAVRDRLALDPWIDTHLRIDTIERWTIRLDGRGPRS